MGLRPNRLKFDPKKKKNYLCFKLTDLKDRPRGIRLMSIDQMVVFSSLSIGQCINVNYARSFVGKMPNSRSVPAAADGLLSTNQSLGPSI